MRQALELAAQLRDAISDQRVLAAIATIPRERFVLARDRSRAYDNVALSIPCGQTISQPLVVARMLELLAPKPEDRVLDVGTGSGYHAALLGLLAGRVWTVERHSQLSITAKDTIARLGLDNVTFIVGDGGNGLPPEAPFDAINVAAAMGKEVPAALERQLAPGGRLVAPVGGRGGQHLTLVTRSGERLVRTQLEPVRFVPLVRGS